MNLRSYANQHGISIYNNLTNQNYTRKQLSQMVESYRCCSLKIVSINILGQELMMYFWRSSYGLKTIPSKRDNSHREYYDKIHKKRLENIVKLLKSYRADIICLQETSTVVYPYLGNMTAQAYLASQLGYTIVSESFKGSYFKYNYPPNEQMQLLEMDSGVATLVKNGKNARVKHVKTLAISEQFGTEPEFYKD